MKDTAAAAAAAAAAAEKGERGRRESTAKDDEGGWEKGWEEKCF